ncbi:hypothetical protein LTR94_025738 [Friedmanniomyces endolithicus]|nr:hypothetical protein LTR94_025738 [Friedmanniomyces endolithicus]
MNARLVTPGNPAETSTHRRESYDIDLKASQWLDFFAAVHFSTAASRARGQTEPGVSAYSVQSGSLDAYSLKEGNTQGETGSDKQARPNQTRCAAVRHEIAPRDQREDSRQRRSPSPALETADPSRRAFGASFSSGFNRLLNRQD